MPNIRSLIEYDAKNPGGAGSAQEEKLFLFSLLRMIKPRRVLEIGVSRGHMTAWLALALHMNGDGGTLTSVDNWSRAHGGEARSPGHALKRLASNGLAGRVEFVASDSFGFLSEQPDNSFDVVWVDGDHSYTGAYRDITQALRVASHVVGVHDTAQQYTGPREAAADLSEGEGFWVEGCRGIYLRNVR